MLSQHCSVLGGPRDIAWEEKGKDEWKQEAVFPLKSR